MGIEEFVVMGLLDLRREELMSSAGEPPDKEMRCSPHAG